MYSRRSELCHEDTVRSVEAPAWQSTAEPKLTRALTCLDWTAADCSISPARYAEMSLKLCICRRQSQLPISNMQFDARYPPNLVVNVHTFPGKPRSSHHLGGRGSRRATALRKRTARQEPRPPAIALRCGLPKSATAPAWLEVGRNLCVLSGITLLY